MFPQPFPGNRMWSISSKTFEKSIEFLKSIICPSSALPHFFKTYFLCRTFPQVVLNKLGVTNIFMNNRAHCYNPCNNSGVFCLFFAILTQINLVAFEPAERKMHCQRLPIPFTQCGMLTTDCARQQVVLSVVRQPE